MRNCLIVLVLLVLCLGKNYAQQFSDKQVLYKTKVIKQE